MKQNLIRLIIYGLLVAAWLAYWHWLEIRPGAGRKVQQVTCINNLKQIGLAFRIWEGDHGDQYPYNVSTNAGGTMEFCRLDKAGFDTNAYLHFQVMSNEIGIPKILVCPQDSTKKYAADFGSLQPTNVTYLLRTGTNITEAHPREILVVCPIDGNVVYTDGSVEAGKWMRVNH